jgi:hypothetical protein
VKLYVTRSAVFIVTKCLISMSDRIDIIYTANVGRALGKLRSFSICVHGTNKGKNRSLAYALGTVSFPLHRAS